MTRPDPASVSLQELLDRFGGECGGDLQRRVTGFGALATAEAGQLAFLTATRYRESVATSRASAILVNAKDAALLESEAARLWVCRDPYLHFARIAQHFDALRHPPPPPGIAPSAVIDASAVVDPSATIGPQVVIGARTVVGAGVRIGAGTIVGPDSRIGDGSLLHAQAVVYHGCTIGRRCIVHSGAVIGADGFGFAKDGPAWIKIPQVGGVVIGDDVEIGANTTIDRGALDDTLIEDGVKLDNQIQVGHNVRIGEHTIMAAFVGIAGSAVIGKRCQIGGAARIMGHVTIVDDVVISTQTFVSRSIAKQGHYTGYYPMAEHTAFEKSAAVLRRLDGLRDRVRRLETGGPAAADRQPEPERPA